MDALSSLLPAAAAPANPAALPASPLGGILFSLLVQGPAPASDPVSVADEVPDAEDAANLLPWINLLPRLMAANDGAPQAAAAQASPVTANPVTPAISEAGTAAASLAADAQALPLPLLHAQADTEAGATAAAQADAPIMPTDRFEAWLPKGAVVLAPAPMVTTPAAVAAPMGSPQWSDDFGQQVVWTAREGLHSAEIRLHPQEFGSIAVKVDLDDSQARLSFSTTHTAASSAIEQSLPRLRELFAHEGLNLGQVQVFTQTAQDQSRQRQSAPAPVTTARGESAAEPSATPAAAARRRGLLDDYA